MAQNMFVPVVTSYGIGPQYSNAMLTSTRLVHKMLSVPV